MTLKVSPDPTPYAVQCNIHGLKYLTKEEYQRQMARANDLWRCPVCGRDARWDDDNYETHMFGE